MPALTYSGNLWSWTPQLRVEHRFEFSNHSNVSLQGGVLDPLTGEPPDMASIMSGTVLPMPAKNRVNQLSRRGSPIRIPCWGRTFTAGAGGYYSRQYWGFNRNVNGYAATADWNLPLNRVLTLSG